MRKFSKKTVALVVSLALLLCAGVGATLAYLLDVDGPLNNTFTPSEVTTYVDEEFEDGVKSNVRIQNTGDTEAYIRAAVVVSWQNESGNQVASVAPVLGTDYTMVFSTDTNDGPKDAEGNYTNIEGQWVKNGDYYYWTKPVAPGEFTGYLILEATRVAEPPVGYDLCVEILGSGIQSVPDQARIDAGWYMAG